MDAHMLIGRWRSAEVTEQLDFRQKVARRMMILDEEQAAATFLHMPIYMYFHAHAYAHVHTHD